MKNELFTVALILFIVAATIAWPFVIIWSLNYLFAFGLQYNFLSWLAVFVLIISFGRSPSDYKN